MGLSIWHLLVVLAIVLVLFGAKRLRNLGGDLGAAIKGFKDAVTDGKKEGDTTDVTPAHTATAQQIAPQATQSPYAAPVTPQPTVIVQQAQPTAPVSSSQQAGVQTPPQQPPHHHG
jgi:sec-independent protein translocase protein TatA